MAQQFQVLRCYFCQMFQVQQIKKTQKWSCKICNEKQSVLKEEKLSRWNKYLDKSCEEEEKKWHAEKQTGCFLNNVTKNPRKYKKTNLNSIDDKRAEGNKVPGSGKNHRRNSFGDTQACGNAADKSMGISSVEELMVHGRNEETELRNVVLSNQRKSLSSVTFNRSVTAAELACQVPVVQRAAAASNEIANLIDSPSNSQHIPRQTVSTALRKIKINSKHIEANILPEKSNDSSVLPSAELQNMLSKESISIPLVHPIAFSTATGQTSGLFSTGEDFDDYL
ncbi:MRN complex-interacting protein isoform X2 [Paroedura picta]|uniref:MRN complex-interacting protein isoform X2 n=1 Tax=Paroedura picta TaxID=143630 RepID=UPI0040563B80